MCKQRIAQNKPRIKFIPNQDCPKYVKDNLIDSITSSSENVGRYRNMMKCEYSYLTGRKRMVVKGKAGFDGGCLQWSWPQMGRAMVVV